MNPSGVAMAGVFSSWVLIAAAMAVGRFPSRRARVRHRNFAGLAGIVLQGAGLGLAFGWRRAPLETSAVGWTIAATAVVLVSAVFLGSAIWALGKQWSLLPRLVEEHALVERGPYAIVRHPIYTAMLGMLIATGLAVGPSLVLVVAVTLFLVGTVIRTRLEERLLGQVFGEEYALYSTRVPALLPFLQWPRAREH
jgi:protein-S-isoprenylcysteine O-methyltransferase Ste14